MQILQVSSAVRINITHLHKRELREDLISLSSEHRNEPTTDIDYRNLTFINYKINKRNNNNN